MSSAIFSALLIGCAGEISSYKVRCPSLVKYEKEFQTKIAASLDKSSEEIQQLVTDYSKLRDACRSLKE